MTALCIRCWNGVVSDCTSALSTQRLLGRLVAGPPFFVSSSEVLTPVDLGGLLDHIGIFAPPRGLGRWEGRP